MIEPTLLNALGVVCGIVGASLVIRGTIDVFLDEVGLGAILLVVAWWLIA